jgi:DNA-binding SARP family transcriptional activator/tetratricopeptide (TPR) repeat protein/DNA-binding XRE family transcriptional regulator
MAHEREQPSLGAMIRQHRTGAGLTQQELARRAGLSVRALRDLEQDRVARPHAPSMRRLHTALGLSDGQWAELLATISRADDAPPVPLHIGVLGPLSLRRDGVDIEIAAALPRALLGLLALQAGQLVSREEIVDTLWGEHPPRSCLSLVHGYAAQVRALLEPQRPRGRASTSLVWARGGYRLILDREHVDLTRFDQFTQAADQAHHADDTELALERYGQALACWRGPVLADAPARLRHHPAAVAATGRRVAAVLAHADLAIELGHPDRAAIHLRPLVDSEPLHEGLHARLMLALHGMGEQAAALRLFVDLRARLSDELGVEPGPEIGAAHLRILRAQQPPAAAATDASTVPAQLPAVVAGFTGRARQLAELDAILGQGAQHDTAAVVISAIGGTAGVGKTALAVYWAHRVRDRFPGGQLYVNLHGFSPTGPARSPTEVIRGFLEALGVPAQKVPADLDALVALYRSRLADKQMLILLDNARDADQVRPLLPGSPTSMVVVTSRNHLAGLLVESARPLLVDLLTAEEARQLLASRLGEPRVAAEPDATTEIIESCARLPLALSIVAAHAAIHPTFALATFAEELRDNHHRLDALAGEDVTTDVRAVFSWSYQALTAEGARLFRLLGLHPGPDIAAAAAASLAALPRAETRRLLGELARANLIVEHTPGRYTFHDLLRAYAAELAHHLDTDEERYAATHRLLDHYLHTAHIGDRLLYPTRDPLALTPPHPGIIPEQLADFEQALAWFTTERPVLLAAVDHAETTGFDAHTWQLAWTLWTFLHRQGHWHDQTAIGRAAVAATARLADPSAEAIAHRLLAGAYTYLGRLDDAHTHLSRALDLTAQAGDGVGQAHTHHKLSILWESRGGYAEGLDHARQALDLFQVAGHRRGQAIALNLVGWFHALLGDHQQTLTYCQQSLTLHQELGDREGQASTWDSLGYAHHHLGHHAQALACYQHALTLYRDLGHLYEEANTLTKLGDTHHTTGNHQAARAAWQHALTILTDIDHPDADTVRTELDHLDHPQHRQP